MAITDGTMREIERKAKAGQAMFDATPDKIAAYNKFAPSNTFYNQPAQSQPVQNTFSQPSFERYSQGAQVDDSFLQDASNQFFRNGKTDEGHDMFLRGNLSGDKLREVAYYNQQSDAILRRIQSQVDGKINEGNGITNDWTDENLNGMYSQYYAIQDFVNKNYGRDGTDNFTTLDGTSRDELGYNFRDANNDWVNDTRSQLDLQRMFLGQGMGAQQARDISRYQAPKDDTQGVNSRNNYLYSPEQLLGAFTPATSGGASSTVSKGASNGVVNEQQRLLAEAIEQYLKIQRGAIQ